MNRILTALAGVLMLTGVARADNYWVQTMEYDTNTQVYLIGTHGPFATLQQCNAAVNAYAVSMENLGGAPLGCQIIPSTGAQYFGEIELGIPAAITQFVKIGPFRDVNTCDTYMANVLPYYKTPALLLFGWSVPNPQINEWPCQVQ